MSILNVSMGGGTDYSGIILRLGKKTKKTRLGCRRVELSSKEQAIRGQNKVAGRARIRPISKKQAKRNRSLKEKFAIIVTEQIRLYGTAQCEHGKYQWAHGQPANCAGQLVVDHVGTRNQDNADRYENLQILCWFCNTGKSSVRVDYRPPEMKEAMLELDKGL